MTDKYKCTKELHLGNKGRLDCHECIIALANRYLKMLEYIKQHAAHTDFKARDLLKEIGESE